MPAPPVVFISYSHDNEEHVDAVLSLAEKLRSHEVDAWIDQYEESPAEGWLTWLQRRIESAQFVLIVCTETYKKRLDKNEEPGIGYGAVWESQLIAADLYRLQGMRLSRPSAHIQPYFGQDGCLIFEYPSGKYRAFFMAFQSQSFDTARTANRQPLAHYSGSPPRAAS